MSKSQKKKLFIAITIVIIGSVLRSSLTDIGALLPLISKDYSLSHTSRGVIMTIPLIVFALTSTLVVKIAEKNGAGSVLLSALFLTLSGILYRSYGGFSGLYIGTIILSLGISGGNIIVPALIKSNFSHKIALMTSIYSITLTLSAAVSSGISVPLARDYHMGWANSLAIWAIVVSIAIIIWAPQVHENNNISSTSPNDTNKTSHYSIWHSPLAWGITLYLGILMLIFYSLISWIPAILESYGFSIEHAGRLTLGLMLTGIPFNFLASYIASHYKNQVFITACSSASTFIGLACLTVTGSEVYLVASAIFLGIGSGIGLSIAFLLFSIRSPSYKKSIEISGMAQTGGYLLAATGPIAFGLLYQHFHSWSYSLGFLMILCIIQLSTSLYIGKDIKLEE